jgi:hypothetical protein
MGNDKMGMKARDRNKKRELFYYKHVNEGLGFPGLFLCDFEVIL